MTEDRNLLRDYISKSGRTVKFGNEGGWKVLGYGTISNGDVIIEKVSHVDDLKYNLISVGKFCDKGFEFVLLA